jgi:hypothetical protein
MSERSACSFVLLGMGIYPVMLNTPAKQSSLDSSHVPFGNSYVLVFGVAHDELATVKQRLNNLKHLCRLCFYFLARRLWAPFESVGMPLRFFLLQQSFKLSPRRLIESLDGMWTSSQDAIFAAPGQMEGLEIRSWFRGRLVKLRTVQAIVGMPSDHPRRAGGFLQLPSAVSAPLAAFFVLLSPVFLFLPQSYVHDAHVLPSAVVLAVHVVPEVASCAGSTHTASPGPRQ